MNPMFSIFAVPGQLLDGSMSLCIDLLASASPIALLLSNAFIDARIWHAVPLIVVISLVYGATRHEHLPEILAHSIRSMVWVAGFMGIIFALIWLAGFWG